MGYISRAKKILIVSVLLAMYMVLKRFLIIRLYLVIFRFRFSFCFVPVVLCAIILGAKYTVVLEVLGDILGCLLFPRGTFFVGYTISAVVVGIIHGLILHSHEGKISSRALLPKLMLSIWLVAVVVEVGLNTIWSVFYYEKVAINILLPWKIVNQIIKVPIKVVTMYHVVKLLENRLNKL